MLAGLGVGLAVSPFWSPPGGLPEAGVALLLSLILLTERGRLGVTAVALVVLASAIVGSIAGGERLGSIDGGALRAEPGTSLETTATITGFPKTSRGVTRIPVETGEGRVMVARHSPPSGLGIGDEITVDGVLRPAPEWYRPHLRRQGIEMMLEASRVMPTGAGRGGLSGFIDALRKRSEAALSRAMPQRESALAKGFVLGQDDEIDPATEENFQDSGLSHLLAVSGQNIVLLGLLAIPFMALAGIGPRARIVVLVALILIYVPLTGAGASIQRAGIMGLAGLAATAASRPGSRIYAIALAAVVTLALNPRASGDIGWQLSFAAVIGILLLARPLQLRIEVLIGGGAWQGALAAGAAVSIAATVATGPLVAFHFERFPLTTIAANLAVLPAVAPAMWLGMVSAAVGQLSAVLAVPFNLANSVTLSYIAQVAEWSASPSWAVAEVGIPGLFPLAAIYVALSVLAIFAFRWLTPHRLGRDRAPEIVRRWRLRLGMGLGVMILLAFFLGPSLFGTDRRPLEPPPPGGARIEVLDVGQGDAILIRPHGQDPLLVDGGPPGEGLKGALDSAGVERLAAVILTHGDLDHTGGLGEILGKVPVERFLFDGVPGELLAQAKAAGAVPARIAAGTELSTGPLAIETIWPAPRNGEPVNTEEPNARSVVLELSLGGFRMLLTGDAESEAAPFQAGRIDVLKVAHHGSDDAGLPALLAASDPEVAIVSSGEDNRFGHPTPGTIAALEGAGARVARTDRQGTVSVVVGPDGYRVETGR